MVLMNAPPPATTARPSRRPTSLPTVAPTMPPTIVPTKGIGTTPVPISAPVNKPVTSPAVLPASPALSSVVLLVPPSGSMGVTVLFVTLDTALTSGPSSHDRPPGEQLGGGGYGHDRLVEADVAG